MLSLTGLKVWRRKGCLLINGLAWSNTDGTAVFKGERYEEDKHFAVEHSLVGVKVSQIKVVGITGMQSPQGWVLTSESGQTCDFSEPLLGNDLSGLKVPKRTIEEIVLSEEEDFIGINGVFDMFNNLVSLGFTMRKA